MNFLKKTARRVQINYAAIQGSYWTSAIPYMPFAAVFLQYRGLTNAQIGFTIAAASIGSMIIQTLLSDYSDKHTVIPIKKLIIPIYIIIICISAALALIPYPVAFVMVAFIIGLTCANSLNSMLNAMFMQLQNAGLKINYGLPRGIGSISFAIASYLLGVAVEKYSPEILFPIQIVLSLLAVVLIFVMPRPEKIMGRHPDQMAGSIKPVSIPSMLKSNPTLVMFMASVIFSFMGMSYGNFLINIIRETGGNTSNLGLCLLINSFAEMIPMLLSFWLLKKFSSRNLLVISSIGFSVKCILISTAPNLGLIYAGYATSLFSNGFFFFASVYFINEIVKPNERTRGQALLGLCSIGGLGSVIGSAVGGVIVDTLGLYAMRLFFIACSITGVILMFITYYLHKRYFCENGIITTQDKAAETSQTCAEKF